MSSDSTPTEVFEDVDPDPDAVLAEFDVDSPDDLAGSGAHDPIPDDAVAVDDTTAAELFADLQDVATADADRSASDADPSERTDEVDGNAAPVADLTFEFVGDSDVVRDDGDVIESAAADLNAVSATDHPDGTPREAVTVDETGDPDAAEATDRVRTRGSAETLTVRDGGTELELAGPEPTPIRIDDDAFGIDAVDTGP